jgi:hypothetical protein
MAFENDSDKDAALLTSRLSPFSRGQSSRRLQVRTSYLSHTEMSGRQPTCQKAKPIDHFKIVIRVVVLFI